MSVLDSITDLPARIRAAGSNRALAAELGVDEASVRRALKRQNLSATPDNLSHEVEPSNVEIPVIFRDYSHLEDLYLYPLGDIHKGSAVHQGDRWREWVEYLCETPNASLMNTGDNLNAAIVGSKSDVYREVMTVSEAKWQLIEELRPLAETGRIDCISKGNHEDRIIRATGDDPGLDIARVLDAPYVEEAALFVYLVGDVTYEVYMRHGTGNGQSLAQLAKSAQVISADAYITGHTHRQAATADDYFVREGDRVVRKHRYFVSSGSFMGLEGYAAQRGYTPTRIGAPRVFLSGERHDLHVSI